jgi:hypothetical protein
MARRVQEHVEDGIVNQGELPCRTLVALPSMRGYSLLHDWGDVQFPLRSGEVLFAWLL